MNVEQQRNLIKVALYLARGKSPVRFNMSTYTSTNHYNGTAEPQDLVDNPDKLYECGTSCCFAGHGPLVLGIDTIVRDDDTWREYILRVFGVKEFDNVWDFLFSYNWVNDPVEAALRATILLERRSIPLGGCMKIGSKYSFYEDQPNDKEDIIKRLRKLQRSKLKDIIFE